MLRDIFVALVVMRNGWRTLRAQGVRRRSIAVKYVAANFASYVRAARDYRRRSEIEV